MTNTTRRILEIGFDIGVYLVDEVANLSLLFKKFTSMAVSEGGGSRDQLLAGKLHPTYLTVVIDPVLDPQPIKSFSNVSCTSRSRSGLACMARRRFAWRKSATSTTRFSFGFTLFSRYAFGAAGWPVCLRSIAAAVAKWCCRALEP